MLYVHSALLPLSHGPPAPCLRPVPASAPQSSTAPLRGWASCTDHNLTCSAGRLQPPHHPGQHTHMWEPQPDSTFLQAYHRKQRKHTVTLSKLGDEARLPGFKTTPFHLLVNGTLFNLHNHSVPQSPHL